MTETKELAREIAQEIYRLNYSDYVNAETIALMAGFAPNGAAVRSIMADDSFPDPVNFIDGTRTRRWSRKRVREWLENFDIKNHKVLMQVAFGG